MGLLKTTFICWIFSKRCSCVWWASCSSRSLWAARVNTQTTQSISSLDLWCWDTRLHQLLEHLLPDPEPYVQIFDSWIRSKFMDNLPETREYFVIKQVGLPSSPLNQPLESSHKFPLRPSEDPFFYSHSQPSILGAWMRGPPAASFWLQNVASLLHILLQLLRYLIQIMCRIKAYTKCRDEYTKNKIKSWSWANRRSTMYLRKYSLHYRQKLFLWADGSQDKCTVKNLKKTAQFWCFFVSWLS